LEHRTAALLEKPQGFDKHHQPVHGEFLIAKRWEPIKTDFPDNSIYFPVKQGI
jgi:hypothetical protein|tara:strand:- start:24 stop:182 length:159 start_codon:yes stop_codon:yes gene_type:complete